jgi:aryl-alcohol dehydrogenase-like predicted oxidoreductase
MSELLSIGHLGVQRLGIGLTRITSGQLTLQEAAKVRTAVIEKLVPNPGSVLVDTSPIYSGGLSQLIAGDLKRKFGDKVLLATKYFPEDNHKSEDVVASVRASMKAMMVDQIDLLQLHWPNHLADFSEIAAGLEVLQDKDLVKCLGFSNFTPAEVECTKRFSHLRFITCQQEANFATIPASQHTDPELVNILYGVLLQGRLAPSQKVLSEINRLAYKLGCSSTSLVVSYFLSRYPPSMFVAKVAKLDHLADLLFGTKLSLPDPVTETLDSLMPKKPLYIDPNRVILEGDWARSAYLCYEDALRDPHNLIPSPFSLACRLRKFKVILPIKVHQDGDNYRIDEYDQFDHIKKYWAARIAFPNSKIPVLLVN